MQHKSKAKRRDIITSTLDAVTEDQIREFLAKEMKNNKELFNKFVAIFGTKQRYKTNYRAMVKSMYAKHKKVYGVLPCGARLDFDKIVELARAHENRKDYGEAIRAYKELSEVIAENMDNVDDSGAEFSTWFSMTIDDMIECINKQGGAKEQYITYMVERFVLNEPDFFGEDYKDALNALCTTAGELVHWEKLLDSHMPDIIPDKYKDFIKYDIAIRIVKMKITVLEKTKSPELINTFAKYYRYDFDICTSYIVKLQRNKKIQEARHITKERAKLFPNDVSKLRALPKI
ncbi:MAG: hypothetical protein OXC46_00595 [Thaumarchaeota archaeon]|nr:hypothetical protein [Nitrososphaerota archaeon]